MAGRLPKPTSLKLIEGNKGKRALTKQEPDPTYLQDLTPPDWLPASAANVWREVAPRLSASKLLTEVDVDALAMGCVAIAQYRYSVARAGADLVKVKLVTNDDGDVIEAGEHLNPWTLMQSMSFKQAMLIFSRFGMTPADRTRIAVQPQSDLFDDRSGAGQYFK